MPPSRRALLSDNPTYISEEYKLPNDPTEHERLDYQFFAVAEALRGKLWRAPVNRPLRILEVGCGTGLMCIALASAFPSARVFGVDVSPVPNHHDKPENVSYIQGDFHILASDSLTRGSYDFVFSRFLVFGMKDWRQYVKSCYGLLRPGGYIELQDTTMRLYHIEKGLLNMEKWEQRCLALGKLQKLNLDCGPHLEGYITDAGFDLISVEEMPAPFGDWMSKSRPEFKNYGRLVGAQQKAIFKGLILRTLNGAESKETINEYIRMAETREIEDGVYAPVYLAVGRKSLRNLELNGLGSEF